MELIVAMDLNNGIGYKGGLPWKCSEDLKFFKHKTTNTTVVVGRNTAETLPYLSKRRVVCVSKTNPDTTKWLNDVVVVSSLNGVCSDGIVIVAGGSKMYSTALAEKRINKVFRTIIPGKFECDTYFDPRWLHGFIITDQTVSPTTGNIYQTLEPGDKFIDTSVPQSLRAGTEYQYLDMLRNVHDLGVQREGRNGGTRSLFLNTMKFDLRSGFPLLTTKKMFMRGILEEFLFFLRGDSDSTILSDSHVRIWEGNTSKEFLEKQGLPYAVGVMGPMYGYQWRHFNAPYIVNDDGRPSQPQGGIDQLANVVNLIKKDPHSRRILMTSYNPGQAAEGVLYPCHSIIIQFYVENEYLDMSCYNRSQDLFLGVPYNIASSALLLSVVAKLTSKTPRYFSMIMGDTHLYDCHLDQAQTQIARIPYSSPQIEIPDIDDISDIPKLKASDFKVVNYNCHKSIRGDMVA